MAALATVIMMAAWFPYVTYVVPLTACLAVMVVVIEYNKRSAFLTYLVSVVPIMIFCEGEAKLLYVCFAGFYPVLKCALEKIPNRFLEYVLKVASFNLAVAVIYFASTEIFGISYDDLGDFGKLGAGLFLIVANITFLVYDVCVTKMAEYYIIRFHKVVAKILKK